MRVIGAAILSRGAHNVPQGRRFLTEHRMLVMHVLKRSAGIAAVDQKLEALVVGLADSFMVLITATEFLEVSQKERKEKKKKLAVKFQMLTPVSSLRILKGGVRNSKRRLAQSCFIEHEAVRCPMITTGVEAALTFCVKPRWKRNVSLADRWSCQGFVYTDKIDN